MTDAVEVGKSQRSPQFPFIGLSRAIQRTHDLSQKAKRFEVLIGDAAAAWNLGAKSSATGMTVGALLAFGLIEDSGSGDGRKIRVSDNGARIIGDDRPGVKERLSEEAAKKPKLIAEYLEKWQDGRPDNKICISELRYEKGFNEDAAIRFLRVFDDTAKYVQTTQLNGNPEESSESDLEPRAARSDVSVSPSADEEKLKNDRAANHASSPIGNEKEWLRGPLSKQVSYRIMVIGELGPREIGKLIKVLQAQQEILEDDTD